MNKSGQLFKFEVCTRRYVYMLFLKTSVGYTEAEAPVEYTETNTGVHRHHVCAMHWPINQSILLSSMHACM